MGSEMCIRDRINTLEAQARTKREMAVKLQGIAEYLNGIGVKLPTPEKAEPAAPEASTTEVKE